jgi:hypothetical protein
MGDLTRAEFDNLSTPRRGQWRIIWQKGLSRSLNTPPPIPMICPSTPPPPSRLLVSQAQEGVCSVMKMLKMADC